MTTLQKEILQALLIKEGIADVVDGNPITASICEGHAKAAAEVCLRWLERTWQASKDYNTAEHIGLSADAYPNLEQFLKDNDLTE